MTRPARWFVMLVLLINAVAGLVLLAGPADGDGPAPGEAGYASDDPERDALRLLAEQLAARERELGLREAEIEELRRSEEVLRRLAALKESAESPDVAASREPASSVEPTIENQAFEKLQRAYENMEPESAALAISELAALDQEAVIQLLIGWNPRTSGSILDALTQTEPALAAKLSYEIWKRSGQFEAQAASSGR